MPGQPPGGGGGMSLYDDLLDPKAATDSPSTSSTSRTPILFRPAGSGDSSANTNKRPLDPALLRFQPVRRLQPAQKQKPKATFPKNLPSAPAAAPAADSVAAPEAAAGPAPGPAASAPPGRSKLADWVATEEDEHTYSSFVEKRQRGGRRQKKKKGQRDGDGRARQTTDWDELYDPARPTNIEEYLRSDERIAEIREWRGVLYAHRRRRERRRTSPRSSDGDDECQTGGGTNRIAPPPEYSFAPPPISPPRPASPGVTSGATMPMDVTGDDAYARRMALSCMADVPPPAQSPSPQQRQNSPLQPASAQGKEAAASNPVTATISRAPVRYDAKMDVDEDVSAEVKDDEIGDDEDDEDRAGLESSIDAQPMQEEGEHSSRPGQQGFAARMMSKMGWQKGTGLGADGTGIVTGLSVKVEKRRRRPDAEGGGFLEPAGKGRVVGGRRAPAAEDDGDTFGPMSEVVLLRGMLEGMEDLESEVADGLGQEIGEECGEKYGRVERLFIDVPNRQVFIKFTDQVSALRAVNALVGRVFNGNTITPRFYDADKFESGIYI